MTDIERRFEGIEKAVYGDGARAGLLDRMTSLEAEHRLRSCAAPAAAESSGGDAVKLSGDNLKNIIIIILLAAAAASPFASKLL